MHTGWKSRAGGMRFFSKNFKNAGKGVHDLRTSSDGTPFLGFIPFLLGIFLKIFFGGRPEGLVLFLFSLTLVSYYGHIHVTDL